MTTREHILATVAALVLLIAVIAAGVASGDITVDTTRKGYYTVQVNGQTVEGRYTDYYTAHDAAQNIALADPDAVVIINAPYWVVKVSRDVAGPVDPPPVDPDPPVIDPEPTPDPGPSTGWLAREPRADAIKLEPGGDLLGAVATGRDVLLPGGSVYRLDGEWTPRAGQLVGMYGAGARPRIYTNGFGGPSGGASGVQLVRLELIADEDRDGMDSRSGVHIKGSAADWLVEGCVIRGYSAAIVVQGDNGEQVRGVRIHRNILRDTFGKHPHGDLDPAADDYDPYVEPSAHAQGVYIVRAEGVEVTENIFWQIGWKPGEPLSRTKFNHGVYAQQLDRDPLNTVTLRGNFFGRCSSHGAQVRGVGILHDNIAQECAVGFSVFKGGELLRSVVLHGQDIPREARDPRAWGVEALGRPIKVGDLVVAHRDGRGSKPGVQVSGSAEQVGPVVVFDWINSKGFGVDPRGVLEAVETVDGGGMVDSTRRVSAAQVEAWLNLAPGSWDEATSPAAVGAWIRAGYQPRDDRAGNVAPISPMPIFANRPALYPGLEAEPIVMVTGWMIWGSGDRRELPGEAGYKAMIVEQAAAGDRLCINVEHWETDARVITEEELAVNAAKLAALLRWAKEAAPHADIGIYRMLPVRDYWAPVRGDAGQIEAWHEANARLNELAELCDTIYPSVYAFYDRPAEWAVYARANLDQANRYGKPVMAFGHARYHPSNATIGGDPVGGDFWGLILDTTEAAGVAGFVVWSLPGAGAWPADEPWLVATRKHLEPAHARD